PPPDTPMRPARPAAFLHPLLLAAALALPAAAATASTAAAPAADAVLRGRLFDARSGQVVAPGVVVVAGGRVQCAGTPRDCRAPATTPVHDYGQAMLLPGLIDLHVHARPHYI